MTNPPDNDDKLTALQARLNALESEKEKDDKKSSDKREDNDSMQTGLRAGAELVTAIIAGGAIGYGLDQWLSTKPIFLIAMLILGVITGFVNVWRTTQNIGHQVGYRELNDKDNNG